MEISTSQTTTTKGSEKLDDSEFVNFLCCMIHNLTDLMDELNLKGISYFELVVRINRGKSKDIRLDFKSQKDLIVKQRYQFQ